MDEEPMDLTIGHNRRGSDQPQISDQDRERLVTPSINIEFERMRDLNIAPSPSPLSYLNNDNWAEQYREQQRLLQRQRRLNETPEQREVRLASFRNSNAERRRSEDRVDRVARLANAQMARLRHARARGADLENAALNYDPSFDYASHNLLNIGQMTKVCEFCQAIRFAGEAKGICCKSGKVKCRLLRSPPEPYYTTYFSGDSADSKMFLTNIRSYNSSFQMTSFGASGDYTSSWSTFRIQGQVYHRIGSLTPAADSSPEFVQIYFIENAAEQASRRNSIIDNVSERIILPLQRMLHENNVLIQTFKTARELQQACPDLQLNIRADRTPAGEHERRFNAPTCNEVAAILVEGAANRRDIIVRWRNDMLLHIDETHPKYDPLQYPLIYPYGDDGWHFQMKLVTPGTELETARRLSPRAFYSYQLMIRPGLTNFPLRCRALLNQYVVDMYAKIEEQRLRFFRGNQDKLRVESYQGLRDALANEADPSTVGVVILPSTFIGGPRHMQEYRQDAFTYAALYSSADFFITVTCNSHWPEITNLLEPGQTPNERNDIVARVFRQKLLKLMAAIVKHRLFGEVKCHMYSVEWQKRGLPHAHILIWLAERIHSDRIDDAVTAELPDPEEDPILFETVKRCMIHGPCGRYGTGNEPCIQQGRCSKKYPRRFISATQTDRDGYPLYRRRSPEDGGGSFINSRQETIDNRWVVPYNKTLSKMFDCHINVESCSSVQAIKYICKYVTKGSDLAIFGMDDPQQNDEINRYQLGRYINSNESFWRIFEFPIHERFPPVQKLAVHLPHEQPVVFQPGRIANLREPETTLTAFFKLCGEDEFARTLRYPDVPKFYTWHVTSKTWRPRKTGKPVDGHSGRREEAVLGRVFTVSPRQVELNRLRLLLVKIPGPTSFESLRTFPDGIVSTFQEACLRHGLLPSDKVWEETLTEGVTRRMPPQLRSLFVSILTHGEPSDSRKLWEDFKDHLSEDVLFRLRRDNPDMDINFNDAIYNEALILIENECMLISNNPLSAYGLPTPDRAGLDRDNHYILRETSYDRNALSNFVAVNRPKLTEDQRIAFESINQAILNDAGGLFFLDAPGGTGKTFIINLLLAELRKKGEVILATASSGIAATLLAGGRTAHSTFNIPLDVQNYNGQATFVKKNDLKGRLLSVCKCIIWDECTMAHKNGLWGLDLTLRDIRNVDAPFGGVVIVLSGDFRQTLPVIPRSTPADELNACIKNSHLWNLVNKFSLTTNMRVHLRREEGLSEFAEILLSIGNGTCQFDNQGLMPLTDRLCNQVSSIDELINRVFPDLHSNLESRDWQSERAILAPLNETVDFINKSIQDRLTDRHSKIYRSYDNTMNPEDTVTYPIEFLNSLHPTGMPPHELELKIGSTIMVLRNLCPPKVCNGTRLRVTDLKNNLITGKILCGSHRDEEFFIPRISINSKDDFIHFKRTQFPVKLAYAMTINKAQGQSLGVVGIDLSKPCFSHGQLYVACSRVGSPRNMFIMAPNNKTRNVVYPEALR